MKNLMAEGKKVGMLKVRSRAGAAGRSSRVAAGSVQQPAQHSWLLVVAGSLRQVACRV